MLTLPRSQYFWTCYHAEILTSHSNQAVFKLLLVLLGKYKNTHGDAYDAKKHNKKKPWQVTEIFILNLIFLLYKKKQT